MTLPNSTPRRPQYPQMQVAILEETLRGPSQTVRILDGGDRAAVGHYSFYTGGRKSATLKPLEAAHARIVASDLTNKACGAVRRVVIVRLYRARGVISLVERLNDNRERSGMNCVNLGRLIGIPGMRELGASPR
jgi:hypothetical protein